MANADLHDGMPPMLSITNMAKGAAAEMLDEALKRLAENIADVNTSEKAKRKLTFTMTCDPYPDRSGFSFETKVDTKLAGMRPAQGTAYVTLKNGGYVALTKDQRQTEMEFEVASPVDGKSAAHKHN